MGFYTVENEVLCVSVNQLGAELTSLVTKENGREYLWEGKRKDPTKPPIWDRISPVLFPFVGKVNGGKYRHEGREYGMEFALLEQRRGEVWLELLSTEDTRVSYPFDFSLRIGYRLEGRTLKVLWEVTNKGRNSMYFSIGGHPAFLCPIEEGPLQDQYFLEFDRQDSVVLSLIDKEGFALNQTQELLLDHKKVRIHEHLFDGDTLIIENSQIHRVSLVKPDGVPYVTVSFDAPILGIWTFQQKRAPYICLEPWYGRCDRAGYDGELKDKDWVNTLGTKEVFRGGYDITV